LEVIQTISEPEVGVSFVVCALMHGGVFVRGGEI